MGCSSSAPNNKEPVPDNSEATRASDPRFKNYNSETTHSHGKDIDPVVKLEGQEAEERTGISDKIFDRMNQSGNGTVSFKEFTNWVKPTNEDLTPEEQQHHRDQNAWLLFRIDTNRDASINREEMIKFLTHFTVAECKHILDDMEPLKAPATS